MSGAALALPRSMSREALVLPALALLLVAAVLAALTAGRFPIDVGRAVEILLSAPFAEAPETMEERIVLLVRLPRVLLAAIAGAGLAMAGAALQGVFRNPLVAPQILGISPGAAFGGALAILFGISGAAMVGLSFAMGLAALLAVGLIARVGGRTEIVTVILAGLVVGALFGALVSLLQFVADPNGSLPAIVYWLMGSFATATWGRFWLALPGLALGIALLLLLRFRLNLLSLDEAEARSLGVRPEAERWLVFVLVALIVGSQVAVSGIVGWIGLVIPHAARFLVGHDHRVLLPASALLGAAFVVAVDTLARTATTAEIPLGVLTAIVGAPLFAVLLRRYYRTRLAG
ncbi:MAG: iron ABC transporter permease [Acetobacteraceae bacterium]|nr:iron ABC transporter permease [Acetobacteraceae bacterium]MCX7686317.1 iron ABC transporter permease [Acetobacteraceae bacterium]MDW8398799.1 iron ABC transporter permease [Acetobacteraceae bacterium]